MHTKYLLINYRCNCEIIEDICKRSPNIEGPILSNALIIESINLSNQSGLVIASEQSHSISIAYFQGQEHEEGLYAVSTSVYIVPHKYVVGIGRISADLEQLKQIVKLAMNVSANSDWRSDFDKIRLALQNILGQFAKALNASFLNLLPFFQLFNNLISQFFGCHSQNLKFYQIIWDKQLTIDFIFFANDVIGKQYLNPINLFHGSPIFQKSKNTLLNLPLEFSFIRRKNHMKSIQNQAIYFCETRLNLFQIQYC